MLEGWRAQQMARGLQDAATRERLVRWFVEFTNEYPWNWAPAHVDEWTQALTSERHMAPSTIRNYQTDLRLFSEFTVHPFRVYVMFVRGVGYFFACSFTNLVRDVRGAGP